MSSKKKDIFILVILVLMLFAVNYNYLDKTLEDFITGKESVHVDRVIDGDTVVSNDTSIRLLGINSPERGEVYYNEAGQYIEELILNKTVEIEYGKEMTDRYGRTLAYIYYKNKNINLEIVKNGLGNYYFPSGRDKYYNDFKQAWEQCTENLCERSSNICARCIELKEFNHNSQTVVFYNSCSFSCDLTDWTIKDEGRKKFVFSEFILDNYNEVSIIVGEGINTDNKLYWVREDYVWTRTGDSLFLRDAHGGLVLWESY